MSMTIKQMEKLITPELRQRIIDSVVNQDKDVCWSLPFGNVSGKGYREVSLYINKKQHKVAAHRATYYIFKGEIPMGYVLDHTCHNEAHKQGLCDGNDCKHRQCVNPNHLVLSTHKDNVSAGAKNNDNRGVCQNGHLWIKENILIKKAGDRVCLICHKASTAKAVKAFAARKKARA